MKNIFSKLFSVVVLLGVIFSLSSCKNDLMSVEYTPENNNVTFASASQQAALPVAENELTLTLNRGVANEAITVALSLADESGAFTLVTKDAEFAKGEYTTSVIVNYVSSEMTPGISYPVVISFDEADKAFTGYNSLTVNAMLELDYEEYGELSIYSGNFFGLMPEANRAQKLYKAIGTTNIYKIENYYGSGKDVEIGINGGYVSFYSPAPSFYTASPDVVDYPLIKMESAMVHSAYGTMTAWIDADPNYVLATNLADGDQLVVGSMITADVYYTVSAGYFGWYQDTMVVSAVN